MPSKSDYSSSEEEYRTLEKPRRRHEPDMPNIKRGKHKSHHKSKGQYESGTNSDSEDSGKNKSKRKRAHADERDGTKSRKTKTDPDDEYRKRRIKQEPVDEDPAHQRQPARREHHEDEERSGHRRHIKKERREHDNDGGDRRQRQPERSRDRERRNRSPSRELSRWETSRDHEERQQNDRRREDNRRNQRGNPFESQDNSGTETWGRPGPSGGPDEAPASEKEQPNFELSGKLTEDTNTFRGVVIKYNEPEEARKPKRRWRLYPFKGEDALPVLHIHRQSAYLLGRDRKIADIPIDHPSCSKQHAVFQFRLIGYEREDGTAGRRVRPYIIDLESSNGTFVNNKQLDPRRYVELFEKDVLKFGFSSREYVLLHDSVDTSEVHEEEVDDD